MNKKGISNQALVALVIAAVIVSIACTWISLSKLRIIEITGLTTTPTGTVNVSAGAAADISLPVSTISFGTMQNDQSNDTTDDNPAPFQVQNDGNVCVNITLSRDNTNWFTGSSTVAGDTQMNVTCPTNCQSGTWGNASDGSYTYWNNLTTGAQKMIAGLNWSDANDDAEVEIKIHVPTDEAAGARGTTVTFTASDSGLC